MRQHQAAESSGPLVVPREYQVWLQIQITLHHTYLCLGVLVRLFQLKRPRLIAEVKNIIGLIADKSSTWLV